MYRVLLTAALAIAVFAVSQVTSAPPPPTGKPAHGPMIGHMVYFKLKESTPAAKKTLVDACKKYLTGHEGTVFFASGPIAEEFKREVNDRDWDVALHLVFENKAAHDKYADAPRHLKFIEENKDTWAKVRVFDSEFTEDKK